MHKEEALTKGALIAPDISHKGAYGRGVSEGTTSAVSRRCARVGAKTTHLPTHIRSLRSDHDQSLHTTTAPLMVVAWAAPEAILMSV